jgi:hypothetical protein
LIAIITRAGRLPPATVSTDREQNIWEPGVAVHVAVVEGRAAAARKDEVAVLRVLRPGLLPEVTLKVGASLPM